MCLVLKQGVEIKTHLQRMLVICLSILFKLVSTAMEHQNQGCSIANEPLVRDWRKSLKSETKKEKKKAKEKEKKKKKVNLPGARCTLRDGLYTSPSLSSSLCSHLKLDVQINYTWHKMHPFTCWWCKSISHLTLGIHLCVEVKRQTASSSFSHPRFVSSW